MRCVINHKIVDARLIERGSASAPGCSERHFPLLVEYDGRRVWVYDDELDGRRIPGDRGPVFPGRRHETER